MTNYPKTQRMKEVERRLGQPIEVILLKVINENENLDDAARELEVSTTTLKTWLPRLGLRRQWVASRE